MIDIDFRDIQVLLHASKILIFDVFGSKLSLLTKYQCQSETVTVAVSYVEAYTVLVIPVGYYTLLCIECW